MRLQVTVGKVLGVLGLSLSVILALPAPSASAQTSELAAAQHRTHELNLAGNFQQALAWAEKTLAIAERDHGAQSGEAAGAHLAIAVQQQSLGRLPAAEEHYKLGLAIQERLVAADDVSLGPFVAGLGGLLYGQGRFDEAEPVMRKSVALQERTFRESGDERGLAVALYMLGSNYTYMSRLDEGFKVLERSLAAFERVAPDGSLQAGFVLNNLATNRQIANDIGAAISYQQRALRIFQRFSPDNLPGLAKINNNLGFLFQIQNELDKAGEHMKLAITQLETAYPEGHADIATARVNYAGLLLQLGRLDEAEPLLTAAIDTRKSWLPPDHPEIAQSHGETANLWIRRGDWQRAVADLEAAAAIYVTRAARQDAGRGSSARNDVAQNDFTFKKLVKVLYRRDAADAAAPFLAAQRAIGSAAAASLAQMAIRNSKGDPRLAALVRARQDFVAELHALDRSLVAAIANPAAGAAAASTAPTRQRLAKLDAEITALDGQIAAQFPEFTALANPAPMSIAEVQAALGPDEALVVALDTPGYLTMAEESFVWVITKTDARWRRSEIGAKGLQLRVAALRCGLDRDGEWTWSSERGRWLARHQDCRELRPDGLENGPLPFHPAIAHDLYKEIFGAFADLIAGKQLLIVASGPLTTLPFQVLLTEPPRKEENYRSLKWLVRAHASTVLPTVTSLAVLRRNAQPSRARRPYLGVGNPLLDGIDDGYAAARSAALQRTACGNLGATKHAATAHRGVAAVAMRGGIADIAQLKLAAPLPETADEVCDVARLLHAEEGDVLLAGRTSEAGIARLNEAGKLAEYRVLHFATHGALAGEASGSSEPGLILTPPAKGSDADDGYLSASEVAALKLDAEWVILSACNTAAGDSKGAEALSGLARAFFYAGARSLLVSHWYVNSESTVALIKGAFTELSREPGIGRGEALRRSVLALIDHGPPSFAHPDNWAPFVVVGEGAAGR